MLASSLPSRRPHALRHAFVLTALFALLLAPVAMATDGPVDAGTATTLDADAAPLDLALWMMGNGNGNGNGSGGGNSCQNILYTYAYPADQSCVACQASCAAEGATVIDGSFDRAGCFCRCCLD